MITELLRSNDPVFLSWAESRLLDAGIPCVLLDEHASLIEGSLGILPKRLCVPAENLATAQALVANLPQETADEILDDTVTKDDFLGGQITIYQPKQGFRSGSDAVLLAASLDIKTDMKEPPKILDMGCGTGAVALCLAARLSAIDIVGIDIDPESVALARKNVAANQKNIQIAQGDVLKKDLFPPHHFDSILSNPPYFDTESHTLSPDEKKRSAKFSDDEMLTTWIHNAIHWLNHQGMLTLIFRSDRLAKVIEILAMKKIENLEIIPLWPRAGKQAKRMILRAKRGGVAGAKLCPGLVLHDETGYTKEAEAILRHGQILKCDQEGE